MRLAKTVFLLICCSAIVIVMTACKTDVKDQSYTLKYNDETYVGEYNGKWEDDKPAEKGTFVCGTKEDDKYLLYDGEWEKGKMKGKGILETNNYLLKVEKTDQEEGFERLGFYSGDVVDGVPNGTGSFTSKNSDGEEYTYKGDWKNGVYDGHGSRSFKKDNTNYEGTYKNGHFTPTLLEAVTSYGTTKDDCSYTLTDAQKEYLEKNQKIFLDAKNKPSSKSVSNNFDKNKFKKNTSEFKPALITVDGLEVIQSFDLGNGTPGSSYCIAEKNEEYYYLYCYYKNNIVEGKTINATFLPIAYSTYESVDNTDIWAIVGVIAEY